MRKDKGYAFINVSGLAVGMACCLLIGIYVLHEISYDRFHLKGDRVFRVACSLDLNGILYREASVPFPAAEAFTNDSPEVVAAVRLYKNIEFPLLQVADRKYTEERFFFVDANIFSVFDFPLLKGDPETALLQPNHIVLTSAAAQKYFGDEDPVGKTIRYENEFDFLVTGVAADVPRNSHFTFDFLAPLSFQLGQWESQTGLEGREKKWFWTGSWTYLQLTKPEAVEGLNSRLPAFVSKYYPDRIKSGVELHLQPLPEIHLRSHLDAEIEPNGHVMYIYIFSSIAILILVIAGINFVNLTTARSTGRAKEVGVRKVAGANRIQLVGQIIGEAVIACVLAVLLALGLAYLFLPTFNSLTGRELALDIFGNWSGVFLVLGLVALTGILSGAYPAWLLSRFNPIGIIKGRHTPGSGSERLRKILVVAQFSVSTILIAGIGVIYQQLNFLHQMNLGFDKEEVLFVKGRAEVNAKFDTFREELQKAPGILKVGGTSNIPGEGMYAYRFIPEGGSADEPKMLPLLLTDYDFFETMNIAVKQGRGFSRLHPADQDEGFLLNEKAVEQLGWRDSPIGKTLSLFAPGTNEIWKSGSVIGVIENYHFESLHNEVKPLVMTYTGWHDYYAVKFTTARLKEDISAIEPAWAQFCPDWPIEYSFLDQRLERLYDSEQKLGSAVNYFAILAILIASLGLFGLSTFAVERRIKEIGVRKVLGATVAQLVVLLGKDFVKLVVFANLVAWPLTWLAMNRWLQNFAFHTEIGWQVFALAIVIGLSVTLLTVSSQSIRAALANPVVALRHE
jgi:putative ABC transport system permease protein